MSTITIPIEYSKRYIVAEYCQDNIGPRQYYLHNAIGGEQWAIKHNPSYMTNNTTGNWTVECPVEHALIIRLKYSELTR